MRGTKYLMQDASATIYEKRKVGVIGRNGCGKSSLFAALLGDLSPELGTISIPKNLTISTVSQQTPALEISALEYVIDGDKKLRSLQKQREEALALGDGNKIALIEEQLGLAGQWTIKSRTEQLLHGLGFGDDEFNLPVKDFSGGWRMRLNLAQALICNSDLLLLDEPTNHLDLDTVFYLENFLKNYQGTLLCISHDRDFLDTFCTDILHFEQGKVVMYHGNYSDYERLRAERIKNEVASRKKEEAILSHMQAFVDRFRYKASKARQAQSLIKAIDRMKLTAVTAEESPFSFSFPEPERTVEVLATFNHADIGYGDKKVLADVNLQIFRGDRIGLLGKNGQGKSTLIRTLVGEIKPLNGIVTLGRDLKIGYFAQHELESLNENQSLLEHFRKLDPNARESDLRKFLGSYAFSGDKVFEEVKNLSGGEQARLCLALIAYQKPNLLLLDEPTNHLDLDMREALTIALSTYPGALVLVSHDRHLVEAIASTLWLVDNGKVSEFSGDLNDYQNYLLEKNKAFNEAKKEENKISANLSQSAYKSKEQKRAEALFRAQLRPLKLEIEKLEKSMEKARKRISQIEEIMSDPLLYQDESRKDELEKLTIERSNLEKDLDACEEQWLLKQDELEEKQKGEISC